MAKLKVFSASAGSGKTYTLARQVINLLLANPRSYANILAVTFTNKATSEMKERIVGDLDLMANGPDGDPAREAIIAKHVEMRHEDGDTSVDRAKVIELSLKSLRNILLDYGQFSVSTIDKFVQRVIRAFAYEQGLASNYGIQLQADPVINSAMDNLMESMSVDSELRSQVVAMTEDDMEDKGWGGAEKRIRGMCSALLQDGIDINYDILTSTNISLLSDRMEARLDRATREAHEVMARLRGEYVRVGEKGLRSNTNLTKILSADIPACDMSSPSMRRQSRRHAEAFYAALCDADSQYVVNKGIEGGKEAFVAIIDAAKERLRSARAERNTAKAVLANVSSLGVIGRLGRFIGEIEERDNKMHMSGSARLLSDLIDDCPVPFVYEKIGGRYDTIMIDEFQDTSEVQYGNFRPLLDESLAENHDCLLVGDVKQSIYRFRGGDWQLLGKRVADDFGGRAALLRLTENYRSQAQIVNFNNMLFSRLPEVMDQALYSGAMALPEGEKGVLEVMFADAAQIPKKGDGGYVNLTVFSVPHSDADAAQAYIDNAYVRAVKEALDNGYSYSDICILVRKQTTGKDVIDRLGCETWNGEPIPVMSDDSLFVMNSDATVCVANVMNYLVSGERNYLFAALRVLLGVDEQTLGAEFVAHGDALGRDIDSLRGLGILEIIAAVVNRLPQRLKDEDAPFLDAFRQLAMDAVNEEGSDLSRFVKNIEDNRDKWTVFSTSSRPAVKIMTIHKSKGLEFKVVILPDAAWDMETHRGKNTIWCSTDCLGIPEWEEGRIPLTFNESLSQSDFHADYKAEREQVFADNLNMAYVAFTRPKEVLYAWGVYEKPQKDAKKGKTAEGTGRLGKYLCRVLEDMVGCDSRVSRSEIMVDEDGSPSPSGEYTLEAFVYSDGSLPDKWADQQSALSEVRQLVVSQPRLCDPSDKLKINADAESRIIADVEDSVDPSSHTRAQMISAGLTNHGILERVRTLDDLHRAVRQAVSQGALRESEAVAREAEMRAKIESDPRVAEWFMADKVAKVWTEISMVGPAKPGAPLPFTRKRPDRVMRMADGRTVLVDYKFGKRNRKHHQQVAEYLEWLSLAGFEDIEAYLWYYAEGVVERVNL